MGRIERAVLVAAVFVYIVYFGMAAYTFANLPPIPEKVVAGQEVLFTYDDIVEGKVLVQKYGLQDYGSVLGFGGYFGVDYTSYALKIIVDEGGEIKEFDKVALVNEGFARAYEKSIDYFSEIFGERAEEVGLKPNLITDRSEIEKIVAYFMWTAMIALEGYTNGFPYHPGVLEPTVHVTLGTWITFFAILFAVMFVAGYLITKFLELWSEPRTPISLPEPSKAQKIALLGFLLAAIGLALQGLLGGYLMHKYAEPSALYGLSINSILPFNVARALHYTLAVLWIVVS